MGFTILDRDGHKWGGVWKSRKDAWDWIYGNGRAKMVVNPQLRKPPKPPSPPSTRNRIPPSAREQLKQRVGEYLEENLRASCLQASRELGGHFSLVYEVAKERNISFKERREKRNQVVLELIKQNPECSPKEIASWLNLPFNLVYETAKAAGLTHSGLLAKKKEKILEDLKAGFRWREIVERQDTNEGTIHDVARQYGIRSTGRSQGQSRRPALSLEKEQEAARLLRDTKMTYDEIVHELSLPWKSMLTRIANKYSLRGHLPLHPVYNEIRPLPSLS